MAVPMNEITETIDYNLRMLIDTNLYSKDACPRAWLLSKTKRISPNGICIATYTQDLFDQHHDYIERDEEGNIVGMWANFFDSKIEPVPQQDTAPLFSSITSKITPSGNTNQIRVGGSKTFTVSFFEEDQAIEHDPGTWSFTIDGQNAEELLSLSYPAENKVRVKFNGDDSYIGKILTVQNVSGEDIISSCDVEIIAL